MCLGVEVRGSKNPAEGEDSVKMPTMDYCPGLGFRVQGP